MHNNTRKNKNIPKPLMGPRLTPPNYSYFEIYNIVAMFGKCLYLFISANEMYISLVESTSCYTDYRIYLKWKRRDRP